MPNWFVISVFLSAPKSEIRGVTFTDEPTHLGTPCTINLPLSVTTLYLAGLIGIFIVTAFMHLPEAFCLLYGAWYLICLLAGNLFLVIYSICNMTDRSWGMHFSKHCPSDNHE